MEARVITLSENTAQTIDLLGEWGLSVYVDLGDLKVLFDTGQSLSAAYNADRLGLDLKTVDKIVLSHGHFDHTGGLREVLRSMRKKVEVIAHPEVWAPKYGGSPETHKYRYAGIPFQRDQLESLGASFVLDRDPVWLSDNVVTTGEIPMVTEYEHVDARLFIKRGDTYVPDPVLDDRALIIRAPQGLIVIAGCAHRGIVNTLLHAKEITGETRFQAVMGGIHLHRASEDQLAQTIAAFGEMDIQRIGVSHCTGLHIAARLAQEFGDRFFFNNSGTMVSFS